MRYLPAFILLGIFLIAFLIQPGPPNCDVLLRNAQSQGEAERIIEDFGHCLSPAVLEEYQRGVSTGAIPKFQDFGGS